MKNVKFSPMMEQYLEIKKQYPDTLILFRLGDFYELFFDDAKTASRELELVLTGKNAGATDRVPMCGVPYHAVTAYIEKLIKKGYRVGIVEQMEDPKLAKGLVKRDVVQIITPGTLIDVGLSEDANNYILSVDDHGSFYVIGYCDVSTGELGVLNVESDIDVLMNEISNFEAKEIVVSPKFNQQVLQSALNQHRFTISLQEDVESTLEYENLVMDIKDIRQINCIVRLVDYLVKTQKRNLEYLQKAKIIRTKQYLQMDVFTRYNLELSKTIRGDDLYGSLLWVIDKTKTAMGARLLKSYLVRPLADQNAINERLDVVEAFVNSFMVRKDLSSYLMEVYDLPRLIARIGYGNANGKDLVQLAKSLKVVPDIKKSLLSVQNNSFVTLANQINPLQDIVKLIEKSIVDNPPFTLHEGGIIKGGYNKDLDELYILSKGGKEWISEFEAKEKEKTGIRTLKVGYNKVFGFYIEISNSFLPQVQDSWGYIRKQTLSNGERYITQELKEKEDLILTAEEKIIKLEYDIFQSIKDEVKRFTDEIQKLSSVLAYVDVLRSFADVSVQYSYIRPIFHDKKEIEIIGGRHPVLERVIKDSAYVPNDLIIDEDNFLQLITGPNMGGKSTYMRQNALTVIMAQIGCYIPAKSAKMPVFDSIFTRIGASDDLVSGQSTFMVEMLEANNAIRNATSHSLVIFDEIGRGTSTFDGMALAQAIIEHLCTIVQPITLFSTHYHELTELEGKLKGLINVHVEVHEENDKITFLYKLSKGYANKSYGINVARLAHLPEEILGRAKDILLSLEEKKISTSPVQYVIKEVAKDSEIEKKLDTIDPLAISPMQALNILYDMKKDLKKTR